MACKILYNVDKQDICLPFSRLIKISGRKYGMLLRAQSNSFRCESDAEHQTGEQYSKLGKINA